MVSCSRGSCGHHAWFDQQLLPLSMCDAAVAATAGVIQQLCVLVICAPANPRQV